MQFYYAALLFIYVSQSVVISIEIDDIKNLLRELQDAKYSVALRGAMNDVNKQLQQLRATEDVIQVVSPAASGRYVYVVCPSGYRLIDCSVEGLQFSSGPYISRRMEVDDYDCNTLTNALAAAAGVSVKVNATCGRRSDVGYLLYRRSDASTNPTLACSPGYNNIACFLRTPHGEKYTGEEFPQGVIRSNQCVSSRECKSESTCQIYIICQRLPSK